MDSKCACPQASRAIAACVLVLCERFAGTNGDIWIGWTEPAAPGANALEYIAASCCCLFGGWPRHDSVPQCTAGHGAHHSHAHAWAATPPGAPPCPLLVDDHLGDDVGGLGAVSVAATVCQRARGWWVCRLQG